jgi:hypothetical protein
MLHGTIGAAKKVVEIDDIAGVRTLVGALAITFFADRLFLLLLISTTAFLNVIRRLVLFFA